MTTLTIDAADLEKHNSRGKNLDSAYEQAKDYFPGLKDSGSH